MAEVDYYELFGVPFSSTIQEIKKAYRKKALTCHPDKNPDNPNAAALFNELTEALKILTDEKARKAYDNVLKAKKAAIIRHKELDSKRKKFKEDLEARERSSDSRNNLTDAEKLKAEIERLRTEGSKAVEEEIEIIRQQVKKEKEEAQNAPRKGLPVKITWKADKKDETNGGYTQELLHRFLSKYGNTTVIVSLKKKGSAIAEFETLDAAIMAVDLEKGLVSNPLTLQWFNETPSSSKPQVSSHLARDTDFESLVLRKMRQAEERKKLIEKMLSEES